MTSPLRGLNLHSALRPSHGWLAVGSKMPPATRALGEPWQKCRHHLLSLMTTGPATRTFVRLPLAAYCFLLSAFCIPPALSWRLGFDLADFQIQPGDGHEDGNEGNSQAFAAEV